MCLSTILHAIVMVHLFNGSVLTLMTRGQTNYLCFEGCSLTRFYTFQPRVYLQSNFHPVNSAEPKYAVPVNSAEPKYANDNLAESEFSSLKNSLNQNLLLQRIPLNRNHISCQFSIHNKLCSWVRNTRWDHSLLQKML
jgi:hypothetical protein